MRPFLLIWALLTAGVLQPLPASFTIGVLRRDALIVPFASYDGKRWQNYWPVPGNNADVPLSLRAVTKGWWGPVGLRETWQVWTNGSPSQILKVRQPDWTPSYCQKVVGLRTDYQPRLRPPPPGASPYPKDGLAVSPPQPVESIEVLGPDSPERDEIVEAIHARFAEREGAALTSLRTAHINNPRQFPQPPDDKELRAMPPMTVEALYAYGTSPRTYFIEAAREYKRDGACMAMAFGAGWVIRDSGKFSVRDGEVNINSCDRNGVVYMLPLGVMSLSTGAFWIAQRSSWNHETYTIDDISGPAQRPERGKTRWNTPGAGC